MDKKGIWSLSPAYDVTFSYKQDSIWVNAHQMLINGKSEDITREDLLKVAAKAGIKQNDATRCVDRIRESISMWDKFADNAELSKYNIERIKKELL